MKKNFLLAAFTAAVFHGNAQVTKQDFEALFVNIKYENMKEIYIHNVRTYLPDGTSKLSYWQYKVSETTVALKENSIQIKWYGSPDKTLLKAFLVIPYNQVGTLVGSTDLILRLTE